ncbi:MAG: cytochrome c oxidase assembly protein [Nitrosomonas sp.]|nr:cytochrome c oxidase assembly protein [Nitrosomonas sp.]
MKPNEIKSNTEILKKLIVFSMVMFGFGYAMVPLYEKFCEVTGIYELQRPDVLDKSTKVDETRVINIQLDANVRGLSWDFRPLQSAIQVHPGKSAEVVYEISNQSDNTQVGQAIPSYSPRNLERYLKKFECFCFTRQELKGGETRQMAVRFVIDPDLPESVHTVTLSYTFFSLMND